MKLYHRQFSDQGPALVVLHGLYGNHANWSAHARQLADTFAVYGFDARNHGQSDWVGSMTYDEMASDVLDTMDALGLDEVSLVGHSMGGKIAMHVAQHHAARVDRLVVVDIAPVDYHKQTDDVLPAMLAMPLADVASRSDADIWLQSHVPEKGVRDFLLTNLVRWDEGGFRWRVNLDVIRDHFTDLSGWSGTPGRYDGPALFIRGERSRYVLPAYEATTREQFPAAEFVTVADAGHWVHSEKPAEVQALLRGFLAP